VKLPGTLDAQPCVRNMCSTVLLFVTVYVPPAGTYYAAVLENKVDFEGKVVVDVGAGSGMLFSSQPRWVGQGRA